MRTVTREKLEKMTDVQLRKAYAHVMDAEPGASITRERLIASLLDTQEETAAEGAPKEKTVSKSVKQSKAKPQKSHKRGPAKELCEICKKNKPRTPRSTFCRACWAPRRKEQLRKNNITWRKRIDAGKAKHHLTYRGKPTVWSATNKDKALAQAKRQLKVAKKNYRTGVIELAERALKTIPAAKPPEMKAPKAAKPKPLPTAKRPNVSPRRQGKAAA